MKQDTPMHWYMRLESQSFSLFPSGDVIEGRKELCNYNGQQIVRVQPRSRDGRKENLWYLGKVDRVTAINLAYEIWSYIVPPLSDEDEEELFKTIRAGTD